MKTKTLLILFVLILVNSILLFNSCNWNKAQRGAAVGAGVGGAVGAGIGSKSDNTIAGALIGIAVGGATGAIIGDYMDKQAEELKRDLKDAKVERVAEGIKITFASGILFLTDSYQLNETSRDNLRELAKILQKYNDTNILIEGHTDNTGTTAHNQLLSEERASSVSKFLKSNGISGNRITENGYGEQQPVADNSTLEGKEQNRRVDVAIFANKKLKKAAEKGDISLNQ